MRALTKKPEVILYDHTKHPYEAVSLAVHAWTADYFPESPEEIGEEYAQQLCGKSIKAFHKTALEYIDTIWVIKNCSRAFQQQLTRTRLASYAIQSMRVVTKEGFATNGHYTMPPHLNPEQQKRFHNTMLCIERDYQKAIDDGIPVEDARGMLPLNIHSDISMRININALYHMLAQRLCVNTQWEYRQVAQQMRTQIEAKLGVMFAQPIDAPCVKVNKCPMREEYCGLPVWKFGLGVRNRIYENFVSHQGEGRSKVINWLDGDEPEHLYYEELK